MPLWVPSWKQLKWFPALLGEMWEQQGLSQYSRWATTGFWVLPASSALSYPSQGFPETPTQPCQIIPIPFCLLYARSPLGKHLGNITSELSLVPEVPSSLWNVMGTATGMPSECLLWAFWGPCPRSSPPLPVASLPLLPGRRMSRTRAVRLLPFRSLQGYCLVGGRFGAWWYE